MQLIQWECHDEGTPAAFLALDPDPATMRRHDQLAAIQTQPRAFDHASCTGTIVLFKQVRDIRRIDAHAMIVYRDTRLLLRREDPLDIEGASLKIMTEEMIALLPEG